MSGIFFCFVHQHGGAYWFDHYDVSLTSCAWFIVTATDKAQKAQLLHDRFPGRQKDLPLHGRVPIVGALVLLSSALHVERCQVVFVGVLRLTGICHELPIVHKPSQSLNHDFFQINQCSDLVPFIQAKNAQPQFLSFFWKKRYFLTDGNYITVHLFVRLFVHSFIHSFIHSLSWKETLTWLMEG